MLPKRSLFRDVRRAPRGEGGDTLVEVLVTITIVAIASVALLGSLMTSTSASVTDRGIANLNGILRSMAESARYEIQIQPEQGSAGPQFEPCASGYPLISDPYPSSGPPGTDVVVFATGFLANTALTVKVGSSAITPTSGGSTNASGDATILFAAPVAGGNVSVSDGTNTETAKVPFAISTLSPGITATTYASYALTSSVTAYGGARCPAATPTEQQVTLSLIDPEQGNGATDQLSFVVGNFAPSPLVISTSALDAGVPTSTVPAQLTFTASVKTTKGAPETTGSVTWTVTAPAGDPTSCAGISSNSSSVSSGSAACTLDLGMGQQGTYQVAATYTNPSGAYPSGTQAQSTATIGAPSPDVTVTAGNAAPNGLVFTAATASSASIPTSRGCPGATYCFSAWSINTSPSQSPEPTCASTTYTVDSSSNSQSTCTVGKAVPGVTYIPSVTYSGSPYYADDTVTNASFTDPLVQVTSGSWSGGTETLDISVSDPSSTNVPTGTIACSAPPIPASGVTDTALSAGSATCSFKPAITKASGTNTVTTTSTAYTTTVQYTPDATSSATYMPSYATALVPSITVVETSTSTDLVTFTVTVAGPGSSPTPSGSITYSTAEGSCTTTPMPLTNGVAPPCAYQAGSKQTVAETITYIPDAAATTNGYVSTAIQSSLKTP